MRNSTTERKNMEGIHVSELMTRVLRKLDKSGLRRFLDNYNQEQEGCTNRRECEQIQNMIVDILPTLGTPHAVALMRELVDKYQVRIMVSMPLMGLQRPPHPKMIEELKVHVQYINYLYMYILSILLVYKTTKYE